MSCQDCQDTGSVPAGGGEAPEDVDNGYVRCPTCAPRRQFLSDAEFERLVDHLRRLNDLSVTQPLDNNGEAEDFRRLLHIVLNDGDEPGPR